jgi:hypothetical protein
MKHSNNYIDNDKFKELVTDYIKLNYNDTGEWIDRYLRTMETRGQKKPERFIEAKAFAERRLEMYRTRQLSKEDYRKFDKVSHEFCKSLYKIAEGILASMKLHLDPDIDDMKAEAVLAGLKYASRFDEESGTSAFAYFTQVLKNAIILFINNRKEEYMDGNIIPEYKLLDTRSVDQFEEGEYE